MRSFLLSCLLLIGLATGAQTIQRAEYFFDTDPGVGQGVAISVISGDSVQLQIAPDISGLSAGLHKLGIRSADQNGRWSHTEFRQLMIIAAAPAGNTGIQAFEYFIDTDPGTGLAIPVSVTMADSVTSTMMVDLTGISVGPHRLGVRSRNSSGRWSHTSFHHLQVIPAPDFTGQEIVTGEFYLGDTDPGLNQAAPVTVASPADSVTILRDSVLQNLPLGTYKISLRFRNARGHWSHQETLTLTVCNTYGAQSEFSFQAEGNQVFFTNESLYQDTLSWRFGDNTVSTLANPVKTYAAAGNYNVQLITGNPCGIDTLQKTVEIRGLQRINAGSGGNGGVATIEFSGFGFTAATGIALVRNGVPLLPVQRIYVSPNRINGIFNLNGVNTGLYHAVANLGSAFDTLYNAFRVDTSIRPAMSINAGIGLRSRPGRKFRLLNLQNRGNQDAILVPVTSEIGFVPGVPVLSPDYFTYADMVFLANKGIFQHTYSYLSTNGIAGEVMLAEDVDSIRKKKMISYMKLKVPANSRITDRHNIFTTPNLAISHTHGMMVHPPYFTSNIATGNLESVSRDCMNSFLKKAVKKNLPVAINDDAWNTCFNQAYDTLAGTIRDIVNNPELQQQAIPSKAIFSALLARMTQCGGAGMPAVIPNDPFRRIIKDVTYNWFFYENIDSLGRPCFDTVISISGNRTGRGSQGRTLNWFNREEIDDCPGAITAPELAEECEIFLKPCKMLEDTKLTNSIVQAIIGLGSDLAGSFLGLAGDFCDFNTGSVFCEQLCENTSIDPNIKDGPGNNGGEKYVNHLQYVNYSIRFENMDTATAPAAYVEIRDTIDLNVFDIRSFQAGAVGWGDSVLPLDAGRKGISLLKDLRPEMPNKLRIDITVDTITGVVVWKFWTVDTVTLQLTTDPAQGFLPPNVDGEEGMGFVSFQLKPKAGVTSGTVLQNKATIIFDANDPITTPLWEYRIDTTRPVSQVQSLPAVQTSAQFTVNWSGSDAHSGIRYYSVFVSVNDSLYKQWKYLTTETSGVFTGQFGKTYKFFSIALDKAGNFERLPADVYDQPDAETRLDAPLPLTLLSFEARRAGTALRTELEWLTAQEEQVSHFEVERQTGTGSFRTLGRVIARNQYAGARYSFTDPAPASGDNFYRLRMVDNDSTYRYSPVRMVRFTDSREPQVYPSVTTGRIYLQLPAPANVLLYDATGSLLRSVMAGVFSDMDLGPLPAGIYYIRIPSMNYSSRVVKQ